MSHWSVFDWILLVIGAWLLGITSIVLSFRRLGCSHDVPTQRHSHPRKTDPYCIDDPPRNRWERPAPPVESEQEEEGWPDGDLKRCLSVNEGARCELPAGHHPVPHVEWYGNLKERWWEDPPKATVLLAGESSMPIDLQTVAQIRAKFQEARKRLMAYIPTAGDTSLMHMLAASTYEFNRGLGLSAVRRERGDTKEYYSDAVMNIEKVTSFEFSGAMPSDAKDPMVEAALEIHRIVMALPIPHA